MTEKVVTLRPKPKPEPAAKPKIRVYACYNELPNGEECANQTFFLQEGGTIECRFCGHIAEIRHFNPNKPPPPRSRA